MGNNLYFSKQLYFNMNVVKEDAPQFSFLATNSFVEIMKAEFQILA